MRYLCLFLVLFCIGCVKHAYEFEDIDYNAPEGHPKLYVQMCTAGHYQIKVDDNETCYNCHSRNRFHFEKSQYEYGRFYLIKGPRPPVRAPQPEDDKFEIF